MCNLCSFLFYFYENNYECVVCIVFFIYFQGNNYEYVVDVVYVILWEKLWMCN